jgi:hypothetical protein
LPRTAVSALTEMVPSLIIDDRRCQDEVPEAGFAPPV